LWRNVAEAFSYYVQKRQWENWVENELELIVWSVWEFWNFNGFLKFKLRGAFNLFFLLYNVLIQNFIVYKLHSCRKKMAATDSTSSELLKALPIEITQSTKMNASPASSTNTCRNISRHEGRKWNENMMLCVVWS